MLLHHRSCGSRASAALRGGRIRGSPRSPAAQGTRRLLVRRSLRPLASIPPALTDGTPVLSPTRAPSPSSQLSICRSIFCSRPSHIDQPLGPAPVDYRSLLAEEEFHRQADTTLEGLQERLEEYGDSIQLDGFDIDYGNQVLTLKLGSLGTYVINKQTPNRQTWLSSPVRNAALQQLSKRVPRTKEDLLEINGIGEVKIYKYGDRILQTIEETIWDHLKLNKNNNSSNESKKRGSAGFDSDVNDDFAECTIQDITYLIFGSQVSTNLMCGLLFIILFQNLLKAIIRNVDVLVERSAFILCFVLQL